MLLNYFGEQNDHDCGQCDVCLAHKNTAATHADTIMKAVQTIKDYLQDGKAHKLIELKTLPLKTEVLDEAISYMLDEEMLVIKGANVTWNSD
jgi:ATP-dependent DNA helicase RecQ